MIRIAMVLIGSGSRDCSVAAISTACAKRSRAASARPASPEKWLPMTAQASSNALPMVFTVSGPYVHPARILAALIALSVQSGFCNPTYVDLVAPEASFNSFLSTLAYEISDFVWFSDPWWGCCPPTEQAALEKKIHLSVALRGLSQHDHSFAAPPSSEFPVDVRRVVGAELTWGRRTASVALRGAVPARPRWI